MRTTWTFHNAELLGEDVTGLTEESAAQKAVVAVEKLKAEIGIPERINDVGVRPDQVPAMARQAFAVKRILRVNPLSVTLEALESILKSAL